MLHGNDFICRHWHPSSMASCVSGWEFHGIPNLVWSTNQISTCQAALEMEYVSILYPQIMDIIILWPFSWKSWWSMISGFRAGNHPVPIHPAIPSRLLNPKLQQSHQPRHFETATPLRSEKTELNRGLDVVRLFFFFFFREMFKVLFLWWWKMKEIGRNKWWSWSCVFVVILKWSIDLKGCLVDLERLHGSFFCWVI